jgi:hypothetical protein
VDSFRFKSSIPRIWVKNPHGTKTEEGFDKRRHFTLIEISDGTIFTFMKNPKISGKVLTARVAENEGARQETRSEGTRREIAK